MLQYEIGRLAEESWASYPILTFSDAPALGAGEPATVTTAHAVANAVFDATGVRLRQMLFTPEQVRTALFQGGNRL